ncbi:MAG: hypothetical protein H0T76_09745 [Nannocystis sp.]|nr:hypothetical protein [Nannocystis sp.]MBA3546752.1 hypothetical protein [Nannocystis sp.]
MSRDRTQEEVEDGGATARPSLARELFADTLPDALSAGKRSDLEPTPPSTIPPSTIPPRERDDELMAHVPPSDYHRGRLGGYAAGAPMRRLFFALLIAFVIGGVVLVSWWARNRPNNHPQQFQLPAGTDLDSRPRTMAWSGGKARLGLDRQPPGILSIELPDRTLRLAEGSDQAQLKVEVRNGKTVELKVLFGAVVEELAADAQPLLGQ